MSPLTLIRLVELGLTPDTVVRLDFAYGCPSEQAADLLLQHLRAETDYDLSISRNGGIEVRGTTRPTGITLDILKQWVFWMCQAGVGHGDCVFDGWGATTPTANAA